MKFLNAIEFDLIRGRIVAAPVVPGQEPQQLLVLEFHKAGQAIMITPPQAGGVVSLRIDGVVRGTEPAADLEPCDEQHEHAHAWVDARNAVVENSELCIKCGAIRATTEGGP